MNGEVHHRPRYRRFPATAAVGVLREPDEEQERIFRTLVERNAINMDSRATAVCVLGPETEPERLRERLDTELAPVLQRLAGRVA